MKQIAIIISFLVCSSVLRAQDPPYPPQPAPPTNIVAAEYFIDVDPGLGNGLPLAVTAGSPIVVTAPNIHTAALSPGVHYLGVRTRNAAGRWSLTQLTRFVIDADPSYPVPLQAGPIVAAEYFIDTDPGIGNGQFLSITPQVDVANIPLQINISGLTDGIHLLYLRTKDDAGQWSITSVNNFTVDSDPSYPPAPAPAQNIAAMEYFIDTDPGFGKAYPISITPSTDIQNLSIPINISGLSNGIHQLHIRIRNAGGHWSLNTIRDFNVDSDPPYPAEPAAPENIVAAEYFFDTDPGFGAGSPINLTPNGDVQLTTNIDISGLDKGRHVLCIRTKNTEEKWSMTNQSTFYTETISLSPDTLAFGSVPVGGVAERSLVIKNNSAQPASITGIYTNGDFSTSTTVPRMLNPGQADTIKISFTPADTVSVLDSVIIHTTAGTLTNIVRGTGVAVSYQWYISPASGLDFGKVNVNSTSHSAITIHNRGNTPVLLSKILIDNASFNATLNATTVPPESTLSLPVSFKPLAAGAQQASLQIIASSPNPDTISVSLTAHGYVPGAAPVLEFVQEGTYAGNSGVSPDVGTPGLYTYKVLYKSPDNKRPMAGYPRVLIDLDGDKNFYGPEEGAFTMVKEGSGNDFINGEVYTYTFSHTTLTSRAGYQFEATDENGNSATVGTVYNAGPVVTNDVLDLRIFANDISFSKANPQPGEMFTMTARITNNAAVPAYNVPVNIYQDTIFIGSAVINFIGANKYAQVNYDLVFPADGFYPIKVWIDSSRSLDESNILNNYAIRPVIVGSPDLPGEISVTTMATRQACPTLKASISGYAKYTGSGAPTPVAGAEVTIRTGRNTYHTTTNSNGYYTLLVPAEGCGSGNFAYAVTVTDFTLTSAPASHSIPMPCAGTACGYFPIMTALSIERETDLCAYIPGEEGTFKVKFKIRDRNPRLFWSSKDEIMNPATLTLYIDGVEVDKEIFYGGLAPGNEVEMPVKWQIPNEGNPVDIRVTFVYTYAEYWTLLYPSYITYNLESNTRITPAPKLPDLTIGNFVQKGFTSFSFDAMNLTCTDAGRHTVKIYDDSLLLRTDTLKLLNGKSKKHITFSDAGFTPGVHKIRIVIDDENTIEEMNENNNELIYSITVAAPDLSVSEITASPQLMEPGKPVTYTATIRNTGKIAGQFKVRFTLDGVPIGTKKVVTSIPGNDSVRVTSDSYMITTLTNNCEGILRVIADVDDEVAESSEDNNTRSESVSANLVAAQWPGLVGSRTNPASARAGSPITFKPVIRNLGLRSAEHVTVHYLLDGAEIGSETFDQLKAGYRFGVVGSFSHSFTSAGLYQVRIVVDSLSRICESGKSDNIGYFYVRVHEGKPDLEVLSQYISPSSLNPQPEQNITLVGTVKNRGSKTSAPNVMRFFVDDVQLGADVPFASLLPGKDTTVRATVMYASQSFGLKMMKIVVDPDNTLDEERENNNLATRVLLVGEAPDLTSASDNAIRFNPNGFAPGDSVMVSYSIRNNGTVSGNAWVRFLLYDEDATLRAIDSVAFAAAANGTVNVSKKMYFEIDRGSFVTQIVYCDPVEYNLLNNDDTLSFSTIKKMKKALAYHGNLDMQEGMPEHLPGWIGGKLVLDDYDLTVYGEILNADSAKHFIVTNGKGRLKLVNNFSENVYPVAADSSHGNFLKIENAGLQDHFSVRVAPYVLKQGNTGDTLLVDHVNRTWFVDEQTPGESNATLSFYWKESDEQSGFDRFHSLVGHYTNGWQLSKDSIADSYGAGWWKKTVSGYTNFSPFIITSSHSAVPVRMINFVAISKGNEAELQWTTTNEREVSHYVLERSADGQSFVSVATVAALNRSGNNHYGYTDRALSDGVYFYRVRPVDRDGKFTYSAVRKILINSAQVFQVFPNPVADQATITGVQPGGKLQLITIDGKVMRIWNVYDEKTVLDMSGVRRGLYVLRYDHNGIHHEMKIMNQ